MSPRTLNYAEAIREGFAQALADDPDVFAIGQGVWSPWYVGSSMKDLDREFGRDRVIDSPVSESATTGAAIGAALAGMRVVVIHPRMDFMLLAVDQIVNQAANWSYMCGGRVSVPVTIRAIVNRGGEQAAQHSQSMHAWFMHVPGLKVVMPSTPYDAKGLLMASIWDDNPVLYIDDRWLYDDVGEVPTEGYVVPIGKAAVRREGRDVTVVATSVMAREALRAAEELETRGIDVEVIDLRSLRPLDKAAILASVRKTGRLVTADGGWPTAGVGAEIAAVVASEAYESLRAPVVRVALPDLPAPMSEPLEKAFYRTFEDVVRAAQKVVAFRR
ncbi:MAG: alpha-ketoacid dehydrogenase subunit beta [Candidatus Rokuibacteriota bacterium]|nr:MAG: alpha-ketoacid dehydrogenase subunit beta [Candidatus Rokubacteria bacterium]